MAYLRRLAVKCDRCPRPGTMELINNRNSVLGRFCSAHAAKALKVQEEAEARYFGQEFK